MSRNLQSEAEHYAIDPSPVNRERVVIEAIPFIHKIVSRLNLPSDPLASRQDLENVAMLGLLQSLDSYDADRGITFITFAYGRVRGALIDYLRSIDRLSRTRRVRLAEAQHATDVLQQQLGDEPTEEQTADYLGVTIKDYRASRQDAYQRYPLSLYSTVDVTGDQFLLETIPDAASQEAFDLLEQAMLAEKLQEVVKELPPRERDLLQYYFFEKMTQREIATLWNLSEVRISQIRKRTLRTLRERLTHSEALAA